MVGGGHRRDDGALGLNRTNVFAALETLRRKKKSDKEQGSKKGSSSKNQTKEPEQVFWAPAPLTAGKSWADVDDDDDDYYATTAPPVSVWGSSEPQQTKSNPVEESESEEDPLLDEGDEDIEEEHENEQEVPILVEPVAKKPPLVPFQQKDTERQLSKKELKKKELAELEAVLAEFGIANKETNGQAVSHEDKKPGEPNGEAEKKDDVHTESKNAKKKKAKKEKSSKEAKEQPDEPNGAGSNVVDETAGGPDQTEEDTSTVDVKERLKKVVSLKKKKPSGKDMDSAAKAATLEAAARSAKLAAAKKKEKSHYNQQPVR